MMMMMMMKQIDTVKEDLKLKGSSVFETMKRLSVRLPSSIVGARQAIRWMERKKDYTIHA